MPTSLALGKPITGLTLAALAKSPGLSHIVDVGPGLGVYSRLFRDLSRAPRWSAVEAWAPYIDAYNLARHYDNVVVADVRYLDFQRLGPIDAVLFGDILEHMNAADAIGVLERAARSSRYIIISVPVGHWPQDEIDGNPFEAHVEDHLTHERVQAMVPGLCGGLAYTDRDGRGMGIYFAASDGPARTRLQAAVGAAEAVLEGASGAALATETMLDFEDDAACTRFRDAITGLAGQLTPG